MRVLVLLMNLSAHVSHGILVHLWLSIHIDISCGRLGYADNAYNVVAVMVDATM